MKKILSLFMVLFICVQIVLSQGLLSVEDYIKISKDKNIVLVSARKPADYAVVHITGAVNVDLEVLQSTTDPKGILKDPKTVAEILGKVGINPEKKIVVYCKTGVNAGRLYWILRYLGCKEVYILDGQMQAWRDAKKPVTKTPTVSKPVTFTPKVNASLNVDKNYVKTNLNNSKVVLVDVRSKEDYDAGHIGNALSLPHNLVITEQNKLKSKEELLELFKKNGITPDKEIILYCKSGAKAGLIFFILNAILNYPNVKVYDGSYNEWSMQ